MKRLFILLFSLSIQLAYGQLEKQRYDSIINASRVLRGNGSYQLAIENYLALLGIADKALDKKAYLYNVLANTYLAAGEKPQAITYYYKAIQLNKELGNTTNLLKNYLNVNIYYRGENQLERGRAYLRLAEGLVGDRDDELKGMLLAEIAIYHRKQMNDDIDGEGIKHADTAAIYFIKALHNYRKNSDFDGMSNVYTGLANMYLDKAQYEFAKENFIKAIKISDSIKSRKLLVTNYRNLGVVYLKLEKYDSALWTFNKSLSLSAVEKSASYQVNIYHNLVQAMLGLGKVEEASTLFIKLSDIRDSIAVAEKKEQLKDLETKYETNLKEQEIEEQKVAIEYENFQKKIYLVIAILLVVLILVIIRIFNQKQRYLRKLKNEEIANVKKAQELNELNAMMHGQEEERNRIANDLHDRLGARLSSIKLQLQNNFSLNGETEDFVKHIDEAIKETREISHNLSSDLLTRFGLQTALKDSLRSIQESGTIDVDLAIYGVEKRWHLEVERNVYYILLELINNTIKHAGAKHLMIQISQVEDEVNIFYEDDGIGFDKDQLSGEGLGMRSLQARVNAINGQLSIDTRPQSGFNAVITLSIASLEKLSQANSKIS